MAKAYPKKVRKLNAIEAGEWKSGSRKVAFTRAMLFGLDSLYMKQQVVLMPQPEPFDEWLGMLNTYYNSLEVSRETLDAT